MTVSVVIPTKDRLGSLRRVLPTYLDQREVTEVIVVVDGSTDGTLAYVEELAASNRRVRVIDNGTNRGIPYSKNAGIDVATAPYVFTGEDDVELSNGFFGVLLDHMRASGADVIAGRNIWRREHESAEDSIARTDRYPGPAVDPRRVAIDMSVRIEDDAVQLLISSPMLAPTEIFRRVRFDERYQVNFWREETDFQVSALELGYRLVSCPHAICFNFMIEHDRGGVYARVGLRRIAWVAINNWRFVTKHRDYLGRFFHIGHPVAFEVRTVVDVYRREILLPQLVRAKRRVSSRIRAHRRA